MNGEPGRIDVHHHLLPPAFVATVERLGLREVAGAPLPEWSPSRSLEVMDARGIQTAILSLSAPGVFFGDVQQACDLARACNEYAADVRGRHPGRFGFLAVLPMPFTAPACAEAGYALDTLGADGVVLLGSTEGRFLGDAAYEDLMAELDARRAVVFVHPNLHASSRQLGLEAPAFLLEFLCDTARAALNLILTGTLERYPRIRWILAHGGGFLPYAAWQTSLANAMPGFAERAPRGVLSYVRRFHYDTALSPSASSLAALTQVVDPSRIVFGTDYPYVPAPLVASECETLEQAGGVDLAVTRAIDRGTALCLFPRYRCGSEVVPSAIGRAASAGRRNRSAFDPLGVVLERLGVR